MTTLGFVLICIAVSALILALLLAVSVTAFEMACRGYWIEAIEVGLVLVATLSFMVAVLVSISHVKL